MTRSTEQLRRLWAPPCVGPWARIQLYGEGVVTVDPLIVEATRALSLTYQAFSYETRRKDTGAYNCRGITRPDGSRDPDRFSLHAFAICIDANWQDNPYGVHLETDRPLAMDVAIEQIRTKGGHQVWRCGRFYRVNKDPMHTEVVASPAELATGIDWTTVPGHPTYRGPRPTPTPNPTPNPHDDEERELMAAKDEIEQKIEGKGNDVVKILGRLLEELEERLNLRMDKLATRAAVVRRKGDEAVFVVSDSGKTHVQREELNLLLFLGLVAPWPGAAKGTSTIPVVEDSWLDDLPEVAELRDQLDALGNASTDEAPKAEKVDGAKKAPAKKAAAPKPDPAP